MGIATTHEIKRDLALRAIYSKLESATDRELGDMLDIIINNAFYNFVVVKEFESDQDGWASRKIESMDDFPIDKYEY